MVKEKGTVLANSETVLNIKNKVGSGVNYVYGKFFGANNEESTQNQEQEHKHEISTTSNVNVSNTNPYDAPEKNEIEDIVIDNQFTSLEKSEKSSEKPADKSEINKK